MSDKFIKFIKSNSRIIYFIYLYFILSLVFSNQFDFDIENQGIKSTIWSVQAGVSILAITMIAITMGYNDTRIYGMTVREIVFNRNTGNLKTKNINLDIVAKVKFVAIVLMSIHMIASVESSKVSDVIISELILIIFSTYIYVWLEKIVKISMQYEYMYFTLFIAMIRYIDINSKIILASIAGLLIMEIIEGRNEISYYERIVAAIILVGMCGFFVITNMTEGVIVIAVLSLINILYLTYYSVEYILNYENMKNGHRENILEIFKRDIEFENEVIANE